MDVTSQPDPPQTGIADVDREHVLELLVVREIQASLRTGARERTLALLERLTDITEAHFLTETLLMRQHGFDGYDAHQLEHDRLIGELHAFSRRVADDQVSDAAAAVQQIEDWLMAHMATEDQVLGAFLQGQQGT